MRRDTIQDLLKWYRHQLLYRSDVHLPSCTPQMDRIVVDRSAVQNQDLMLAGDAVAFKVVDMAVRDWCDRHAQARDYKTTCIMLCFEFKGAKKNGLNGYTRASYDNRRQEVIKPLESYLLKIESVRGLIREPDGVVLG